MKPFAAAVSLLALPFISLPAMAQSPVATKPDAWLALSFLEGTWDAKTAGSSGVDSAGSYTFKRELDGHILARHSRTDAGCKGPDSYDCEHGDLLYVYEEAPGQPLNAICFDNEGHVIHYDVSTPAPGAVVFLSELSHPGPQFRLAYELKDSVMSGRFQMRMPGQTDWRSYLEWSGRRK
jgi:hypothetical protein